MRRLFRISTLLALAGLAFGVSATADAAPVYGSQAFADVGSPTLVGSTDINFATGFKFGTLVTTASQTGGFASVMAPSSIITPSAIFTPATPGTFSIGSVASAFGLFTATSTTLTGSSATSQSYIMTGLYTPGTAFGGGAPEFAQHAVGLTQAGGAGSAISISATIFTTLAVPEPASVVMLGLGLAGLGGVSACRRRRPA